MVGYNAVFGLEQFDRGRELLESVLRSFEQRGLEKEAGFLRNSIAFSLFRVGRIDDAAQTENAALELLEGPAPAGSFLASILLLNLGRLYRSIGFSDRALDLFRTALRRPGAQHGPSTLLLLYASIAYLESLQGRPGEALSAHETFSELARDLDLDDIGAPVLNLLARPLDLPLAGHLTRGDLVFFYLYLNLALDCQRLGWLARSEAYLAGMKHRWSWLGEDIWKAVETALSAAAASTALPSPEAGDPLASSEELPDHFADLVELVDQGPRLAAGVAESLAAGKAVAVVGRQTLRVEARPVGSLVLLDPREGPLAALLNLELGVSSGYFPAASGYAPLTTRAALVLPEELCRFGGELAALPLIQQDAVLEPQTRNEMTALDPFRLRIQVLSHDYDRFLFEVLQEFARKTGLGVLAAIPFHLRRRNLALDPKDAMHAFLATSVDQLIIGEVRLGKCLDASSEYNLLPLRPKLTQHAMIEEGREGEDGSFRIRVRIAGQASQLRLSRRFLPALRLCDGTRTLAELIRYLRADFPKQLELEKNVCALFRKLDRQGVIHFAGIAASLERVLGDLPRHGAPALDNRGTLSWAP